jgi:endonuclease/exonuclease/phosphatase family metal-dependent hydrolase
VQFVLYNLHLESRGFGATRLGQLKEVLADARQYGPEVTVVIAGDLNSKYLAGRYESKLERAGFQNCFERRVRTHVLIGALDWIFVRGPGVCEGARVVRGTKASDHDPLTARIMMPSASRHSATHAVP